MKIVSFVFEHLCMLMGLIASLVTLIDNLKKKEDKKTRVRSASHSFLIRIKNALLYE